MTKGERTNRIKALALEVGFTKVGVASADPLSVAGERLEHWLQQGFHATMGWMARNTEKRFTPRDVYPEANSILSVALNYYHPSPTESSGNTISRYAWGTDYHTIMPQMLEALLEKIQAIEPSAKGRYYVDTGPVM